MQHITIYREPGRYAGWPANYGIWAWGDEIVVGFTLGYFEGGEQFHTRDKSRPFMPMQARSLNGGLTWAVAPTPCHTPGNRGLSADEHMNPDLWSLNALADDPPESPLGNINFTHPDFALMCGRTGLRAGSRSWFYISYDRCHPWQGPYDLPMFNQTGIAARTDYLVDGPDSCTLLLTAAKPDGEEGRVFCARTTDAGKSFHFVNWVTPEPKGFTIMPASVRLPVSPVGSASTQPPTQAGRILTAVRCSEISETTQSRASWIDLYASDDNGESWQHLTCPVPDAGRGGNPPTLTILQDGRLALAYGYRNAPFGMRALLSNDNGQSWSDPIHLTDGAGNHDIGYPRTVQRSDGTMITVYYTNDAPQGERYIAATLWEPPAN